MRRSTRRSPAAVELHTTETAADGTATMTEQDALPVPAGGELELAPIGDHLMLVDLTDPLTARRDVRPHPALRHRRRRHRRCRGPGRAAVRAAVAGRGSLVLAACGGSDDAASPPACPTSTLAALDGGGAAARPRPTSAARRSSTCGRRGARRVARSCRRSSRSPRPSPTSASSASTANETGEARSFLDGLGITYEQYVDERGQLAEELGAAGLPVTVVVDADGCARHAAPRPDERRRPRGGARRAWRADRRSDAGRRRRRGSRRRAAYGVAAGRGVDGDDEIGARHHDDALTEQPLGGEAVRAEPPVQPVVAASSPPAPASRRSTTSGSPGGRPRSRRAGTAGRSGRSRASSCPCRAPPTKQPPPSA